MKNITKLVRNDEKIKILKLLYCDEKYTDGRASDFEWFEAWEGATLLCAGHKEREAYARRLSEFQLSVTVPEEYSRVSCMRRWRAVSGSLFEGVLEDRGYTDTVAECDRALCKIFSEHHSQVEDSYSIELNKYVTEFITEYESISHLSRSLTDICKKSDKPYISLNVDIYNAEYTRPDPYLGQRAFNKKKRGEKLNLSEENTLVAQLLVTLIIGLKGNKKISIIVDKGGQSEAVLSLVKYLAQRKLFEGDIFIKLQELRNIDAFAETVASVFPKIFVCPVIDLWNKKPTAEELGSLFYQYPIGALRFPDGEKYPPLCQAVDRASLNRAHYDFLLSCICSST